MCMHSALRRDLRSDDWRRRVACTAVRAPGVMCMVSWRRDQICLLCDRATARCALAPRRMPRRPLRTSMAPTWMAARSLSSLTSAYPSFFLKLLYPVCK